MQHDKRIFEEIVKAQTENRAVALAVVTGSSGSAPQRAGAKMLVQTGGAIIGTVGGGPVEAEVIRQALECLDNGSGPRTLEIELNRENGFMCGGRMSIYLEPLLPLPLLIVLGAGHVGKAAAAMAGFCGFRVRVIDDRPEYANRENIPTADEFVVGSFAEALAASAPDHRSSILIATRGHEHDLVCLQAALKTPAAFIGVVGSRRKRRGFLAALKKAGFGQPDLERFQMPVGLAIGAVSPEEIGVSIMAQLIESRRRNAAVVHHCPAAGSGPLTPDGYQQAIAALGA